MVSSCTHKMAQIARLLGWLCVVYLFLQGPSPGLVLCFGANGHVAAEAPHSRYPHPTSQSQAPCLDLPLVSMSSHEHPFVTAPPATSQSGVPVAVLASVLLPRHAAVASDSVATTNPCEYATRRLVAYRYPPDLTPSVIVTSRLLPTAVDVCALSHAATRLRYMTEVPACLCNILCLWGQPWCLC